MVSEHYLHFSIFHLKPFPVISRLLIWPIRGLLPFYQICKIAGCACAGNAGNVFPAHWFQRKPLVSDPGMHHGTCITHVPRCMSTTRGGGKNVPGIPGACTTRNFTYVVRGPLGHVSSGALLYWGYCIEVIIWEIQLSMNVEEVSSNLIIIKYKRCVWLDVA